MKNNKCCYFDIIINYLIYRNFIYLLDIVNILLPVVLPNEDYRMLHGYRRQTHPLEGWARLNAQLFNYLYLKNEFC